MKEIEELLDSFARNNIRLAQGSFDMDSVEKDRAELLRRFSNERQRAEAAEAKLKEAEICIEKLREYKYEPDKMMSVYEAYKSPVGKAEERHDYARLRNSLKRKDKK